MELVQSDDIVALHRLVVAEAGRFPEIGELFYEAGPKKGETRFEDFFRAAIEAGKAPPQDPRELGQRLKDLVMSDIFQRHMWGVSKPMTGAELQHHVGRSVDVFMRAYGMVPG
jgi:hypothetical protein